jgi:hypothetical protein
LRIKHFPNKEYCIEFLRNINESGLSTVFLQIRHGDEVSFKDDYSLTENVIFSSRLNSKFIGTHLTNYKLTFESDVNQKKIGWRGGLYQYLKFEKI